MGRKGEVRNATDGMGMGLRNMVMDKGCRCLEEELG